LTALGRKAKPQREVNGWIRLVERDDSINESGKKRKGLTRRGGEPD